MKKFIPFAFFLVLIVGAPVLAQNNVTRIKVRKGEPFTFNLKKNSTYIVNPFPDLEMPEAKIISGGNCIYNAGPFPEAMEYYSMFQTNSRNCKMTLSVVWDGNGSSGLMTLIRVNKIINIDLTSEWQRVTMGKGTYAVWARNPLMVAEIADQTGGCREAHDGRNNRLGLANPVYTHTNEDNTAIEGAVQEKRTGINSWTSWFRILPKRCKVKMRSILNGNGQSGRLTLLKLSGKPISSRG